TRKGFIIFPVLRRGPSFSPFVIKKEGKPALYVDVQNIQRTPPFDTAEKWQEFRDRLDKMHGVRFELLPEGNFYRARYSDLANDDALKGFQETIAWSIEQVKSAPH
ncbi:MAG: hypothetical protein QOI77_1686, partial [Blastocatellia bacterium]|nr:hypothetical protein [Blastocatellia bacterium]